MSVKLLSIDIAADLLIIFRNMEVESDTSVHANVCVQVCVSLDFRYSRRLIARQPLENLAYQFDVAEIW